MWAYVTSDFSVAQRLRELALGQAADLQDHRRLGEPRGLDAAVGADPGAVRRAGGAVRPQPAADAEGPRAGGAGAGSAPAFLLFILFTSNPFAPRRSGAARGQRPQPDPAGHRPRHPSAAALPRLCRLLDRLLLRRRRADRGPHRRRLGALGAAVDAGRLDLPDARHRHGLLLGLLRARLGRLVVLGPGRERLASCRGWPAPRCCTPPS